MSQTAYLTSQSLLDTPNVSIKEESSLIVGSTEGSYSTATNSSENAQNTSNEITQKQLKTADKDMDDLTEKLKILKTRLDFKLTIADISKDSKTKSNHSSEFMNDKDSRLSTSAYLASDSSFSHKIKHMSPKVNKDKMSVRGGDTPYPLNINVKPAETCIGCLREAQSRINTITHSSQLSPAPNSLYRRMPQEQPKVESFIWSGTLPIRSYKNPRYSNKVFLGGIPWDMTEQGLYTCFKQFGSCSFEWPGKDSENGRHPPKGYVYILFESERSVKNLLYNCIHEQAEATGEYYFRIAAFKTQAKNVQVIPWVLSDSSHLTHPTERLDTSKTIFVGGLHGMMTAEALAHIFNDIFGSVMYAGIDTDKHKYPIGSGRITFNNYQSYAKAIQARFIEIKTSKFAKKVQIDPYLEESMCTECENKQGPFFCREFSCFKYYCQECWYLVHNTNSDFKNHKPVTRQARQNICSFDLLLLNNKNVLGQ